MNSHLFIVILYIFFTYSLGYSLLIIKFNKNIKSNNLFLNLGLSWGVGNLAIMLALYALIWTNKFYFINIEKFILIFLMMLLVIGISVLKKKIKINKINILIFLLILIFFLPLIKHSLSSPLNAWDSLAIWMLKAKSFFIFKNLNNNTFFQSQLFQYAHKEYPIGLSLIVALYYQLIGFVNDQSVQLYLLMFYLNIIFLFFGFFHKQLPKISIFLKLLVTLGLFILPNFLIYAHNGYADMLISFYIMISLIYFIEMVGSKNLFNKIVSFELVVMNSAATMLIKNEGYVFFAIVLFIGSFTLWKFFKNNKNYLNKSIIKRIISIFLFLILMFLIAYKWQEFLKFKNIQSTFKGAYIPFDWKFRLKSILNYYILEFLNTSRYSLALIIMTIIAIYEYLFIFVKKQFKILLPSLILLMQLISYIIVYLITPHSLVWQIGSSIDRLTLHFLPAFFIIVIYQAFVLKYEKK